MLPRTDRSIGRRQSLAAAALGGAALSPPSARAAGNAPPIVGTWRLTSATRTDLETNTTSNYYGERPAGLITYTPGGHVVVFLTSEGRRAPAGPVPTETESAELFSTIISAYAGTYRVEGDKIIHRVETAWTPVWNGTEQVRTFAVEGDRLTTRTAPLRTVTTNRMVVAVLTYARVE
jgi:lipocalin-like protein